MKFGVVKNPTISVVLWVDLLLRATHKDTKFLLGNTTIELIPGQVFTSELKIDLLFFEITGTFKNKKE